MLRFRVSLGPDFVEGWFGWDLLGVTHNTWRAHPARPSPRPPTIGSELNILKYYEHRRRRPERVLEVRCARPAEGEPRGQEALTGRASCQPQAASGRPDSTSQDAFIDDRGIPGTRAWVPAFLDTHPVPLGGPKTAPSLQRSPTHASAQK